MLGRYYPNLFKLRYVLRGKAWVRDIEPEDLRVFVSIGAEHHEHGRMGGRAIADQRGADYMRSIGRIGAISANSKRAWVKALQEEQEKIMSRIEELEEMKQEYILNHSDVGQESISWGELAELQARAESQWDETDEGRELKALRGNEHQEF